MVNVLGVNKGKAIAVRESQIDGTLCSGCTNLVRQRFKVSGKDRVSGEDVSYRVGIVRCSVLVKFYWLGGKGEGDEEQGKCFAYCDELATVEKLTEEAIQYAQKQGVTPSHSLSKRLEDLKKVIAVGAFKGLGQVYHESTHQKSVKFSGEKSERGGGAKPKKRNTMNDETWEEFEKTRRGL